MKASRSSQWDPISLADPPVSSCNFGAMLVYREKRRAGVIGKTARSVTNGVPTLILLPRFDLFLPALFHTNRRFHARVPVREARMLSFIHQVSAL